MNEPTYDFQHSPFDETYTFISEGKHGAILKMVRFREIEENIWFNYNLYGNCPWGHGQWRLPLPVSSQATFIPYKSTKSQIFLISDSVIT